MPARFLMIFSLMLGGSAFLLTNSALAMVKETTVGAALMKKINPDGDGTVDLAEAKAAGKAMFKKLNPDKDGTLDMNELKGRISEADFKAANPDGDGTLDENELKSPAGQKLLALIA